MIRIGQYDAFDKWHILCRYWQNKASVPDLGLNKFERPRILNWHEMALYSGSRACADYVNAKVNGIIRLKNDENCEDFDAVTEDMSRLLEKIGYTDLATMAQAFADSIAQPDLHATTNTDFSPELSSRMREIFQAGALGGLQWTNELGEIPSIEVLREQTSLSFPKNAIRNKDNVLSLFSARFYGRSDVIHIYDAEPKQVTLVDIDQSSLDDMRLIYPKDWVYFNQDYADFLRDAEKKKSSYDLIVSDPYRGYGEAIAWDSLPLVMRLCDTFITNYFIEMFEELKVQIEDLASLSRAIRARTGVDVEVTETVHRSPDVHWVVMRKGKSYTETPDRRGRLRFGL